ncbi:MAG: D-glycerate dehydrogenase [Actinobacteria bacterium]|nr:MAG: D-glycerate dehydrogenase [Actinomycetota bacterium]
MRRTLPVARVLITRRLPFPALDRLAAAGHDLDVWPGELPPPPDRLRELARDAEGLLCLLTDRVDDALLDAAPRLRAIAVMAVGTDNVDLEACRRRGIPVGSTPGVLTEATADLAFALLLAAARRLLEAAAAIPAGKWRTWEPAAHLGADVHGATLGIVGYGRIGQAVARRAQGFDMRIVTTRDTELTALLETADFVTLHVPLTERTRHLIDADALERMKPTAILVNTSRGGVVDQAALADALHRGAIAGAALDVTDPEPLPASDPLLAAPHLLVVPHIGSATHSTRARMADLAVDNLLAALAAEPMPHPAA